MEQAKDFFTGVYKLIPSLVEELTDDKVENCVKYCHEFSRRNIFLIIALMAATFFAQAWYFSTLENQLINIQKDEMIS